MSRTHIFPLRVYYEDTDAQGIVYHANYLKFTERARTEMMRDQGFSHADHVLTNGSYFVMRRAEIDYLAPAKLDDLLQVATHIIKIGNASVTLQQNILRHGQIMVASRVVLVCINADGKPARVPLEARAAFAAFDHSLDLTAAP